MRVPARLLLPVLLAGPALLLGEARPAQAVVVVERGSAQGAPPDTIRARVLERIRAQARASEDTAAADTLPEDRDPERDGVLPGPSISRDGARPIRAADLPADADSMMQALARLPGYRPSTYEGTRADFQAGERVMVLRGSPEHPARFSGEGNRLEADSSITYNDLMRRVWTVGPTLLTPEQGDVVRGARLVYDLSEERGSVLGAQTTYTEGAHWIVQGDLPSVRDGELFGSGTRFTSCELDPPHSYFRADQLKVVRDRVLVARSVQMYVEDVPVMWLPFIAQNLGSGRASGILTPTFSMNDVVRTSTGHNRRISNIGYYWAMSNYSDMTVAMDWFSNNYIALNSSLQYRWRRQFLDGNLDLRHFWRDEGGRELTLRTRHNWEYSERTRLRANARFVSSTRFVTRNTFDPRELNQTIDSDAGLTHRFDWGQLSLGANRKQFLNEDRTDMTLPTASLSLSTLTLFGAPPQQASWYNNMSLTGSTSWSRDLQERPLQADTAFTLRNASNLRTRSNLRGSLGLGRLSLSGDLSLEEQVFEDVPGRFFVGAGAPQLPDPDLPTPDDFLGRQDFKEAQAGWSVSLGYQQNLIGSTTITPSFTMDGTLRRVDSIPQAREFVAGPPRFRMGARLQTDLYAFYPGFSDFDGVRHKVTPSVSWSYSPEVTQTELQERVFGDRGGRVQNQMTVGFNQTWEAKVREPEEEDERSPEPGDTPDPDLDDPFREVPEEAPPAEEPPEAPARDTVQILRDLAEEAEAAAEEEEEDPEEAALPPARQDPADDQDGPRRLPQSRVVTLLAIQTNAISYDLVERDETGRFLDGFTTTTLSNSIRSDYLQGLSLSFAHDLFDDTGRADGEPRRFSPHLSQLNVSFSVDHRSGLVRTLAGLLGLEVSEPEEGDRDLDDPGADETDPVDPTGVAPGTGRSGFDHDRMVPGDDDPMDRGLRREGWNARIAYSLRRPRATGAGVGGALTAQMIQTSLTFSPSAQWDASWSTSYDVEAGRFNDHMVNLTRDLHEWEATFGFRQTATGNWSFHFEVSLRANRDLRMDFQQRSLEGRGVDGRPIGPLGPG